MLIEPLPHPRYCSSVIIGPSFYVQQLTEQFVTFSRGRDIHKWYKSLLVKVVVRTANEQYRVGWDVDGVSGKILLRGDASIEMQVKQGSKP